MRKVEADTSDAVPLEDASGALTSTEQEVTLTRLRHPWRVTGFIVVVGLLLILSFIAGKYLRSPNDAALSAAKTQVDVYAEVEERVVQDESRFPASIVKGGTHNVTVPALSPPSPTQSTAAAEDANAALSGPAQGTPSPVAEKLVVTGVEVTVGTTVTLGQVLGEVSGRPIITLPASIPLYRDLTLGAKGADVTSLQAALIDLGYVGVADTGTFDQGTLDALQRLYRAAGYEPPVIGGTAGGLAWREIALIPVPESTVTSVAKVGAILDDKTPFVSLQTSPNVVKANVTVLQADKIKPGQPMNLSVGGGPAVPTKILSIGPFYTDEKSGKSGHDIFAELPAAQAGEIGSNKPIQLSSIKTAEPTIAVPLIVVQQDDAGSYVELKPKTISSPGDKEPFPRVYISILEQSEGWASFTPVKELPVGTEVRVPQ